MHQARDAGGIGTHASGVLDRRHPKHAGGVRTYLRITVSANRSISSS
jgi:hypothetical protein